MELMVCVRLAVFGVCFGAVSHFAAGQCSQVVAGEASPEPVSPYAFAYWDSDGAGPLPAQLCVAASFGYTGDKGVFRWNGQRWETIGQSFNGSVFALSEINGSLYAAGSFTKVGGQDILRIARWDGAAWVGIGAGFDGNVYALTEFRGELVAAGAFANSGSMAVRRVAAWNGSEWRSLAPNTGSAIINSLRPFGQLLIAGGSFTSIDGVSARNVAAFDGTSWKPLGAGVSGDVRALGEFAGKLVVGGLSGGGPAPAVRMWDGTSWMIPESSFLTGQVNALHVMGGLLYAGGSRLSLYHSTEPVDGVVVWDGVGWSPVGGGETGLGDDGSAAYGASCLSELDGQIVAGGLFVPSYAGHITRFTGSEWVPVSDALFGNVRTIMGYNGRFVAAGDFIRIGGERTNYIMSWTGAGWEGLGAGLRGSVSAATEYNGQLVVSGGVPRELPANSGSVSAWNGNSWQSVGKFSAGTPQVFTEYNGQLIGAGGVSQGVTAWNGSAWSGLGSGVSVGTSDYIRAAQSFSSRLIVAGKFTVAGGVPVNNMAAWDGSTWSHAGGGVVGFVNSMVVWNGKLIVGGQFTFAGDTPVVNAAAWDGTGTTWTPMNQSSTVSKLIVYQGDLLAQVSGQSLLKKWNGSGWEDFPFDPAGTAIGVMGGEIAAANLVGGQLIRPHVLPRYVSGSPVLPTQPQDPLAYCGAPASMSVIVDNVGDNTPSYRWRRGSTPIFDGPTGTGSNLVGTGTPSLTIEDIGAADAGSYDVEVTNSCGSIISDVAEVTPNCCPADLTSDGFVDDGDLAMFASSYNAMLCAEIQPPCFADFNRDGVVDDLDFQVFVQGYSQMVCE
ncbi:MAG: hypothetical protein KF691_02095 [Phycisphaeraceae bacterium]|nr:hypothetical protein [Phycisphaeraceae bacterium]